jgi:ribosomal protein S18 acetylase RimI-like enzyme
LATVIARERADSPAARALIGELESELEPLYPKTSRHGYSVDELLRNGVAFFVTRHDGTPAGCGGVQVYGTEYGELKRMYVRPGFRGLGLGRQMLERLAEYGREHGVGLMRLETGIYQAEAIGLYERFGFRRVAPFGGYRADPLSVFYEMRIGG